MTSICLLEKYNMVSNEILLQRYIHINISLLTLDSSCPENIDKVQNFGKVLQVD